MQCIVKYKLKQSWMVRNFKDPQKNWNIDQEHTIESLKLLHFLLL